MVLLEAQQAVRVHRRRGLAHAAGEGLGEGDCGDEQSAEEVDDEARRRPGLRGGACHEAQKLSAGDGVGEGVPEK